jgi:hypothetical protein
MTPAGVRQLAGRGRLRRYPSLRGALYSRAEVEALGRLRAETLELTGKPGRPRRRETALVGTMQT